MSRPTLRTTVALAGAILLTGVAAPAGAAVLPPDDGMPSGPRAAAERVLGVDLDGHTLGQRVPARGGSADRPGDRAGWEALAGTDEPTAAVLATGAGSRLVPISNVRVIDTREDVEGPIGEREVVWFDFSELPLEVAALVLNVTTTRATAHTSFITVLDGDAPDEVPTSSSLNASRGRDVANLVTVPLAANGLVGIYNNAGETDVVVDVQGVYVTDPDGAGFEPVAPTRVLDTRGGAPLISWDTRSLPLPAAPADAVGVAVTITSTQSSSNVSWVGAWAPEDLDATQPGGAGASGGWSSILNPYAGSDVPNLAILPLGQSRTVDLFNHTGVTHLVVDVVGWFVHTGGASYHPISAQRAVGSGVMGPASERAFTMPGAGVPVPGTAAALAVNLTTSAATHPTYLTAYPSGGTRPWASSANARLGADVATSALTRLGPGFTLYNNAGTVRALVDVQGYFSYDG